jgi:hypothetical protein
MDLPEQREGAAESRRASDRGMHSAQRRRDAIMEFAKTRKIYDKCKKSEIVSKNLLWWKTKYHSDDAVKALL